MHEKFQNKYRNESIRLQNWDYRWAGAYFITICTENREHYFGEIENGKMKLSHLGVIADIFWHEIPARKPFVKLGEYVIMPNHIHGILIIDDHDAQTDIVFPVGTLRATSPQEKSSLQENPIQKNDTMSNISPKSNSISTLIRSYKSAVTKHGNRLGILNGWQSRFYDYIIRDDAVFERISNYIKNNPVNWKEDKFFESE